MDTREFLDWLVSNDPRGAAPRCLVLVAHPDDEAIGLGSRLGCLSGALIVHVTDGAPRSGLDARNHGFSSVEDYARKRRSELRTAMALAGVADAQLHELQCADQEATANLEQLTRRTAQLIAEFRPEFMFTHPYEGGHPDHDATAFIAHASGALVRDAVPPAIVEMASYHNSAQGIETGEFLPDGTTTVASHVLTAAERELKRRMLNCFSTQRETLALFRCEVERFRRSPTYDFSKPPHAGRLFYELYPWGMTGARFCEVAARALAALELRGLR